MLSSGTQADVLVQVLLVYATVVTLRVGLFSIAPVGFAAVSGYVAAILMTKTSLGFPVVLIIATASACLLSVGLGLPLLRLRGVYAAVATMAFVAVVSGLASSLSITGGSNGVIGIPESDVRTLGVVFVLVNLVIWYVVEHTHIARALDTVGANPVLAASMALRVPMIRLGAIFYSGLLSGLAGVLYARGFYVMTPDVFAFPLAVSIAAMAVIGGTEYWLAPLVVAVILSGLTLAYNSLANWIDMVQGLIMVAVIVLYPDGLSGVARRFLMPRRSTLVPATTRTRIDRVLARL